MEEKLKAIFAFVHEMVKFAEAKNAILVALNGAAILGLLKIVNDTTFCSVWIKYYLLEFILLATIGLLISLLSFYPRLKILWIVCEGEPNSNDNLLLYSDICKYNEQRYLDALAQVINEPTRKHSQLDVFYTNQIIVNSRIATSKYLFFRKALWCTLSAILTPLGGLIISCFLEE